MKLLLDFLPLILFFGTFRYAEGHKDWASAFATEYLGGLSAGGVIGPGEAPVVLSTVVMIFATLAQVIYLKARGQKVHVMLWVSLALVIVLGGLTVWFHSETFIKWKPSALYWTLGLVLWISRAVFGRNLLKSLLGKELVLPDKVWQRLNFAWVAFFGLMGLLNIWVAYSFETSTWVDFKVFGVTGMMFVFMLAQAFYMNKHLPDENDPKPGNGAQS